MADVIIRPGDGELYFLNAYSTPHGTSYSGPPNINDPKRMSVVLFGHSGLDIKNHGWGHFSAASKSKDPEKQRMDLVH